jgi:hypothetical protein
MTYKTRIRPRDTDAGRVYDGQCACLVPTTGGPWETTGWPQRKLAAARLAEHTTEHETGEPARELVAFRDEAGLNGPTVDVVGFADEEG